MDRLLLVGLITIMGIVLLPAMVLAQSSAPIPALARAPSSVVAPTLTRPDPREYLEDAQQQLDAIPASIDKDAQKAFSQLRGDFKNLVTNYEMRPLVTASSATSDATAVEVEATSPNIVNWRLAFDDVERGLAMMLGTGAQPNARWMTAVGTPGVRTQLQLFRQSVELFYDATTGTGGSLSRRTKPE